MVSQMLSHLKSKSDLTLKRFALFLLSVSRKRNYCCFENCTGSHSAYAFDLIWWMCCTFTKFLYYAVFNVHGSPGKLFSPANFYILARPEDHVNIFFEVFSNFLCNCHRLLHKTDYVGLLSAAGPNALCSELLYISIIPLLCQHFFIFFHRNYLG